MKPTDTALRRLADFEADADSRVPDHELDDSAYFSWLDYWFLLRAKAGRIIALSLLTSALAFVLTSFVMPKSYRAIAVIRPVARHAEWSALERNLPGFVDYAPEMSFSPFSAESERAQEYMTILSSHDFTTALIHNHQLAAWVDAEDAGLFHRGQRASDWDRYRFLKSRFETKYDLVSGSLHLAYVDRDPAVAQRILSYYVDGLRAKLRQQEVGAAQAAVVSLTTEYHRNPDPIMNSQLSELISRQLQREELAQVEADFAFEVIDSPAVPDRPDSPRPLADSAAAGALALLALVLWIVIADFIRRRLRAYDGLRR